MKRKDEPFEFVEVFNTRQEAIDYALWMNFKYRVAKIVFGVSRHSENEWWVYEEATGEELGVSFTDALPTSYSQMSYDHISQIAQSNDPMLHWEAIRGMISSVDGEILRYIIQKEIPLERLIRHELSARGFDENHRWCGFEKAREIWLKDV